MLNYPKIETRHNKAYEVYFAAVLHIHCEAKNCTVLFLPYVCQTKPYFNNFCCKIASSSAASYDECQCNQNFIFFTENHG